MHKQNFIARLVNQWFDRVMGALSEGCALRSEGRIRRASHAREISSGIRLAWAHGAWSFPYSPSSPRSWSVPNKQACSRPAFVTGTLLMILGEFRCAHLSGLGCEREAYVHGLPDQPLDHLRGHGGGRGDLLSDPVATGSHHVLYLDRRVSLPHGRRAGGMCTKGASSRSISSTWQAFRKLFVRWRHLSCSRYCCSSRAT